MDQPTETEWICHQCGTLLGIERAGRMHLKYKRSQFLVTGKILAVCRRCSEINEIVVTAASTSNGEAA
ncbi:MAG TPA: hypothetical protein VKP30_04860 [Polyangiaceae bacterium]|nr:hypothetical protein [Polyangiaceae bacterium]